MSFSYEPDDMQEKFFICMKKSENDSLNDELNDKLNDELNDEFSSSLRLRSSHHSL
jgi:hypothetical protein